MKKLILMWVGIFVFLPVRPPLCDTMGFHWGDCNQDGVTNAVDVVYLVNLVYFGNDLMSNAIAAAPTIDSLTTGIGTPWSQQMIFRMDDSLAWIEIYYDTDTTGGNYSNVTDSAQSWVSRWHGQHWIQDLTGGTVYYYKAKAWISGVEADTIWGTAGTFTANATGDTTSITPDTHVYICNTDDKFYQLPGNKNAAWSAIEITGNNVLIDGRGHTVTYGNNVSALTIPNHSFEDVGDGDTTRADKWVFSNATYIKRRAGQFYRTSSHAPRVWDGTYGISFEIQDTDTNLYVTSEDSIIVPFGGDDTDSTTANIYVGMIFCYGYPPDVSSAAWDSTTIHFEAVGKGGDTINWTNNHQSWDNWPDNIPWRSFPNSTGSVNMRGIQAMHFYFPISGRPDTVYLSFGIHGYYSGLDSVMFDFVSIDQANYYGIFSPYNTSFPHHAYAFPPEAYTDESDVSGGVSGARIVNMKIKHASNSRYAYWCHPIYTHDVWQTDNWDISGVTMYYAGANTSGIWRNGRDGDTITFCHVVDSGKVVERRADAACNIELGYDDGENYVAFNFIDQARQLGIGLGHGSNNDTASYHASKIEWNYIYTNTDYLHTNGFAIAFGGKASVCQYNTIIGLLGPSATGGGINGIYFSGQENVVRYNWIYCQTGRNTEYVQYPTYGIQLESAGAGNENHVRDAEVGYNTAIVSEMHSDGGEAAALRLTNPRDDNWVHHNWFEARDSVGDNNTRAFSYGGETDNLGDPCHQISGNLSEYNHYEGDDRVMTFYYYDCDGKGWDFREDTMVTRETPLGGFGTIVNRKADRILDSNCVFINCTDDDISFDSDGYLRTIWTLSVRCEDEEANAIDNIYIRAIGAEGDSSTSGTTSGGYVHLNLPEYHDDYSASYDSTFTPYVIHADSAGGGRIWDSSYAVTSQDTLVFVFGGQGAASRKVRVRR